MDDEVKRAVAILKEGGIVIFPTDTAFGIGCRIDDREAVDRLFRIRQRPRDKATPVLVDSIGMAKQYYADPDDTVEALMHAHWPGALTIVAPCRTDVVYEPVRGSGATIGLRMPDHETILSIIGGVGVPLLGPSANFHGKQTPHAFEDVDPELIALVDAIVPGTCKHALASTVVAVEDGDIRIIRQGTVNI